MPISILKSRGKLQQKIRHSFKKFFLQRRMLIYNCYFALANYATKMEQLLASLGVKLDLHHDTIDQLSQNDWTQIFKY